MIRPILTLITLITFITAKAQIDGSLLLGLTPVTNTEMAGVTTPVTGSLVYNTNANQVFQYNGSSWQSVGGAGSNWSKAGNSGTNPATDYLGTTGVQDLVMKTNGAERFRLHGTKGQVMVNQATSFNNHPLVVRANGVDVLAFEDNTGVPKWHWNLLADGLNFVESNVADYRLFLKNGGDVGVGTNAPTERLDVNGSLRIRSLGTAASGNDILTTTSSGVVEKSKMNYGGRWTNTNTTTNLNVNNVPAPIFGTNDYVDGGTGLYQTSSTSLTVMETGRYDIRANISLLGINDSGTIEQRTNAIARIAVNGTPIGAKAASGYIRFATGHENSSIHLNEILELAANDVVSIIMYRGANSGAVRFDGSGASSFTINKIR